MAGAVVGQDALDGDSGRGEVGVSPLPERGGGLLLLIGQDLAVGEAGVVVDGVVQVAVADAGAVLAARLPADLLVPAADGDIAEFLDVDVHQLAGPVAFRRRVQPQQVGDAGRPPAAHHANLDYPAFGAGWGPARAVVRPRGPVAHAVLACLAIASGPPLGRGRRDLEAFGGPAQGPSVINHAAGKAQSAGLGQGCITVGHEGLLLVGGDVAIHTEPGRPSLVQDHPTVIAVTNLPGQNT